LNCNVSETFKEALRVLRNIVLKKRNFQKICQERQKVIDELKVACDERLALLK
jgi:hypothetical protein